MGLGFMIGALSGRYHEFSELLGKVFIQVTVDFNADMILFYCADGTVYQQRHDQDCCESVYIEDIVGSFDDMLNEPILLAEEVFNHDLPPEGDYRPESYTWTFYKLATMHGYVTIRWYGESNGYYSETAQLIQVKGADTC